MACWESYKLTAPNDSLTCTVCNADVTPEDQYEGAVTVWNDGKRLKKGGRGTFLLLSRLPNVVKLPSEFEPGVVQVLEREIAKIGSWSGEDEREELGRMNGHGALQRILSSLPPPLPPPPSAPTTSPPFSTSRAIYYSPSYPHTYLSPAVFKCLPTPLPQTLDRLNIIHIQTESYEPGKLNFLKSGVEPATEIDLVELEISTLLKGKARATWEREKKERALKRKKILKGKKKKESRAARSSIGSSFIDRNDDFWLPQSTTEVSDVTKVNFEQLADPGATNKIVSENEETWKKSVFSFAKVAREMGSFPTLGESSGGGGGGGGGGDGAGKAEMPSESTTGAGVWGAKLPTRESSSPKPTQVAPIQNLKKSKKGRLKYKPLVL